MAVSSYSMACIWSTIIAMTNNPKRADSSNSKTLWSLPSRRKQKNGKCANDREMEQFTFLSVIRVNQEHKYRTDISTRREPRPPNKLPICRRRLEIEESIFDCVLPHNCWSKGLCSINNGNGLKICLFGDTRLKCLLTMVIQFSNAAFAYAAMVGSRWPIRFTPRTNLWKIHVFFHYFVIEWKINFVLPYTH